MGFELASGRALMPGYNTILKSRKRETLLLGCQNFQIIKTSMVLVPARGRGSLVEDDPEVPMIHRLSYDTHSPMGSRF